MLRKQDRWLRLQYWRTESATLERRVERMETEMVNNGVTGLGGERCRVREEKWGKEEQ